MTSMLSTCSPRHWQTQVCTDCFRLKLTIVFLTFIACFFLLYSPHFPRLLVVYSARFWCIERRYLFSTTPPWIIIIFFILKKLMPIYLITKYCLDDIILDLWYSRHSCLFKEFSFLDLKRRKHKRLSFSKLSSAAQNPIAPCAFSTGENKAISANEPTSLPSSKKLMEKGVKQSIWATPLFLVGKWWPCSCPAINQGFFFAIASHMGLFSWLPSAQSGSQ